MRSSLPSKRGLGCVLVALLIGVTAFSLPKAHRLAAQGTPVVPPANFDSQTQTLIAQAERVVFLIPFSHWDTDWHDIFAVYSQKADQNITKAIQLAKQFPRFRYTIEQVLFAQHFWDAHPEYRDDLKALVHNRQLTFAWGGITQPETSLVAPAIQVRNLQLGQDWIAQTFGPDSVPQSAWQSDAFGNSAAFPTFLSQSNIPYLYIGRWQGHCDPDYQHCQPLPPAFYWTSPAAPPGIAGRVLTTYISYPTAWANIYQHTNPDDQLAQLRKTVKAEFQQTTSKYLFLPVGFDFFDPQANLPSLVDRWNTADQQTVLVMSDPESAFQYLATQPLPEITTDLNPIWQAFYDTRPAAKVADKKSEYYLTAADKFGLLVNAPTSTAWNTAAFSAHYDNIGGVSYDSVWNSSQYPRYTQTITTAQADLSSTLTQIATRVPAPLVVFNPSSWPRSDVIELMGDLPDVSNLPGPVQRIGPNTVAFMVENAPPLGYIGLNGGTSSIVHTASIVQSGGLVTLTNGLISVTLDGEHGGAFSNLDLLNSAGIAQPLLTTFGDDVTYFADTGDVYGAFFGQEIARESKVPAQLTVLASGPLLARVQATFALGGQQVIKTVTMHAEDSLIDVALDISALPNSTALVETPTNLDTTTRTDDLGFGSISHTIDPQPIVPGDITYRRSIFYPITYWSDVSTNGSGLTVITHGLQGVAGGNIRSFMLVRQVTSRDEGVTDPGVHHLNYAYLPHTGNATDAQPWLAAYSYNQPLIAVWHSAGHITVQLPFDGLTSVGPIQTGVLAPLPISFSLLSAQNAIVSDIYRRGDQVEALVLNYEPSSPASLSISGQAITLSESVMSSVPITLPDS